MNIVQTPVAPLSPELIARFRAIVGEKYAVTEASDVAPYVTEERGLFHGHSPLVLRPGSTAQVAAICKLANEHDNPRRRTYESSLLSITCKRDKKNKTTIVMPRSFVLPDRRPVEAFRTALAGMRV